MKPLDRVRVISIEHAVAAPLCTRYLAALGADVIKIERPLGGDFARWYDSSVRGLSAHFVWLNVGKRSVALDLKRPEANAILWDLLKSADVFVSNLGPGSVKRLTGTESVREHLPAIIECCIAGYSLDGPYFDRKAYDLLLQGEAGVTKSTGTPDHPAKAGVSVADLAGGQHAALAILAALLGRSHSGDGATLSISLFDVLADWMSPLLLASRHGHAIPAPAGTSHTSICPYGAFLCSDAVWVNVAVQNEDEWHRLCTQVLQDVELGTDARYASNEMRLNHRAELESTLAHHFAQESSRTLIDSLTRADIGWGLLREVEAVVDHPELAERHRWQTIDAGAATGPIDILQDPLGALFASRAEGKPAPGHLPGIGEHTFDVLRSLGYGESRLLELDRDGVIAHVSQQKGPLTREPMPRD